MNPAVLSQITSLEILHRQLRQIGIRMDNGSTATGCTQPNRGKWYLAAPMHNALSNVNASTFQIAQCKAKVFRIAECGQQFALGSQESQNGTVIRCVASTLPSAVRWATTRIFKYWIDWKMYNYWQIGVTVDPNLLRDSFRTPERCQDYKDLRTEFA